MPSGVRAGQAYVELFGDDSKLMRVLRNSEAKLRRFGSQLTKIGKSFMVVGSAVVAGFIPAIRAASDLQETMNKFNVVFGASAAEVKVWSDTFAKEIGRSKEQIASFMASSQDLFVPLGFEAGAATEMSKQITGLSIDLASFNNMQDADTMRDLQAALTGSGEVMKKYGVIVSEAAVKQELFNQGIDAKAATNAQKVQARLNIILAGTTAAQGDAARSADSYANRVKRLKGQMEDIGATIGNAILPMISKLVGKVSEAAARFEVWAAANQDVLEKIFMVGAGLAAAGAAIIGFGALFNGAAAAIGVATAAVGALGTALTFLMAHPVVLVLAGIAAAATAIYLVMNRAIQPTVSYNKALREQEQATRAAMSADRTRFESLQKLGTAQKLTDSEMTLAKTIISDLESKYGDLGIEVDATSGKLIGLAGAQERVNEAIKGAEIASLQKELATVNAEIEEARKKGAEKRAEAPEAKHAGLIKGGMATAGGVLGVGAVVSGGYDKWVKNKMKKEKDITQKSEIDPRLEKAKELEEKIAKLKAGNAAAAEADVANAVAQKSEDQENFEKGIAERLHDLRISQIKDEEEAAIKAIEKKYAKDREEAKNLGLDITKLNELEAIEKTAIETQYADERTKDKSEAEADIKEEIARTTIELNLKGLEKSLALLALEEKRALEENRRLQTEGGGVDPEFIKEKYNNLEKLAKKDSDEKKKEQREGFTSVGTFSAAHAERLGTKSRMMVLSAIKHVAEVAEKIEANTRPAGAGAPRWIFP